MQKICLLIIVLLSSCTQFQNFQKRRGFSNNSNSDCNISSISFSNNVDINFNQNTTIYSKEISSNIYFLEMNVQASSGAEIQVLLNQTNVALSYNKYVLSNLTSSNLINVTVTSGTCSNSYNINLNKEGYVSCKLNFMGLRKLDDSIVSISPSTNNSSIFDTVSQFFSQTESSVNELKLGLLAESSSTEIVVKNNAENVSLTGSYYYLNLSDPNPNNIIIELKNDNQVCKTYSLDIERAATLDVCKISNLALMRNNLTPIAFDGGVQFDPDTVTYEATLDVTYNSNFLSNIVLSGETILTFLPSLQTYYNVNTHFYVTNINNQNTDSENFQIQLKKNGSICNTYYLTINKTQSGSNETCDIAFNSAQSYSVTLQNYGSDFGFDATSNTNGYIEIAFSKSASSILSFGATGPLTQFYLLCDFSFYNQVISGVTYGVLKISNKPDKTCPFNVSWNPFDLKVTNPGVCEDSYSVILQ